MSMFKPLVLTGLLVAGIAAATVRGQQPSQPVSDSDLRNAGANRGEWLTYGRDYAETRFSPLSQINDTNVARLGLTTVWPTNALGAMEATPLVHDGVMYGTLSYGRVFAFDLRQGKILWEWDPKVPYEAQQRACCGVVNRGVALYQDKVYVGVLDGRLVGAGRTHRSTDVVGADHAYRRVVHHHHGAARDQGQGDDRQRRRRVSRVRGFVSAYDAETGKLARGASTPCPAIRRSRFENPELEAAAKTWTGEWWKMGGGGTVWDAIAYDPETRSDLRRHRQRRAVEPRRAQPGRRRQPVPLLDRRARARTPAGYAWHYQTTPGDTWDYTAMQQIMLADLTIGGRTRKVLMQAPKNGFFYVIDRATGELISANTVRAA